MAVTFFVNFPLMHVIVDFLGVRDLVEDLVFENGAEVTTEGEEIIFADVDGEGDATLGGDGWVFIKLGEGVGVALGVRVVEGLAFTVGAVEGFADTLGDGVGDDVAFGIPVTAE
jgi:hypothetical protein